MVETLQKNSKSTETIYFSKKHIGATTIVVKIEHTPQSNSDWNELTEIARSHRDKDIILNTNMIQDVSANAIISLALLVDASKNAGKKFIICEISSELLSAAVTSMGPGNAMGLFPLDKTLEDAKKELNVG